MKATIPRILAVGLAAGFARSRTAHLARLYAPAAHNPSGIFP